MNDYIINLIRQYRETGTLLDTNILLLYFVGSFKLDLIPRFKRTNRFIVQDYLTLVKFLANFKVFVTTPNILTEVSNLSGQLEEPLKLNYFERFASGIVLLDENYVPSANVSKMQEFKKLGLTDMGIICLAKHKHLVITDDFRLSQYLQKKKIDVLNFNHIRTMNW